MMLAVFEMDVPFQRFGHTEGATIQLLLGLEWYKKIPEFPVLY